MDIELFINLTFNCKKYDFSVPFHNIYFNLKIDPKDSDRKLLN